jgi:hypothetical protein
MLDWEQELEDKDRDKEVLTFKEDHQVDLDCKLCNS